MYAYFSGIGNINEEYNLFPKFYKKYKTTLLISKYKQSPSKIIKKLHLLKKINIFWGILLYILLVKQIINVFIYSLYQNQYYILTGANIRNMIVPYEIHKLFKGR